MGKIKLLIKYFVYRIRRRGAKGHGIHSPFVFQFSREVLNSRVKYPEYRDIDLYRRSLYGKNQFIRVSGHGAGSNVFKSANRRVRDIARRSSTGPAACRLLFRLARYFRAPVIVELGTSLGMAAFCLSRGGQEGKVYSVEACPEQLEVAGNELARFDVDNVDLILGEFGKKLPGLMKKLERVDLVYLDGDHREESVLWQFNQCAGKAGHRSIFIIGDIHWSPGMERAWGRICRDPRISCTIDLFFVGLVFFREGMAKQHYVLKYK